MSLVSQTPLCQLAALPMVAHQSSRLAAALIRRFSKGLRSLEDKPDTMGLSDLSTHFSEKKLLSNTFFGELFFAGSQQPFISMRLSREVQKSCAIFIFSSPPFFSLTGVLKFSAADVRTPPLKLDRCSF